MGSNDMTTQPSEPDKSAQGQALRTLVPCVTAGVHSLGTNLSSSCKGPFMLHLSGALHTKTFKNIRSPQTGELSPWDTGSRRGGHQRLGTFQIQLEHLSVHLCTWNTLILRKVADVFKVEERALGSMHGDPALL